MAQDRPHIPAELKRSVLVEAGHRCAIPTCKQTTIEIAHIVPWAQVNEHRFENLIALCPTCHARFDKGEIDRKAMRQYKANLGIISSRYTDVERQMLKAFVRKRQFVNTRAAEFGLPGITAQDDDPPGTGQVRIHAQMSWMISNLIDDGLVYLRVESHKLLTVQEKEMNTRVVRLTMAGREFIQHWVDGDPL